MINKAKELSELRLRPKGSGRLSSDEAERLPDRLLDAATAVFHEHGYAHATMEMIARVAGASTKTVYARYRNKNEILAAATRRMIDRTLPPLVEGLSPDLENAEPRALLTDIGMRLVTLATAPEAIGFYRNSIAEATRFPELANLFAEGSGRIVTLLARLFEQWNASGRLRTRGLPQATAGCLLDLIVATPRNRALLGIPLPAPALAPHVAAAIETFFDGRVDKT